MKRFLPIGLLLAAGLVAAAPAAAQTPKIAYVNLQEILSEAPGAAQVQQTLQNDLKKYQTELTGLETELDSLQKSLTQQQATLSAAAKQQREDQLQQKFAAYQQRRTELQQTAQQRQQELLAPIMKSASDAIEKIRVEGGYAMIFDAAQGGLVTADPALDLTSEVLARLKSNAPATAPSGK